MKHFGFFVFVVCLSCVLCAKECGRNYFHCEGGCTPLYVPQNDWSNTECTAIRDGKCLKCEHWKLENGECKWNCSKFGEECLYCNDTQCERCSQYGVLVGSMCVSCGDGQEVFSYGGCIGKCEQYTRKFDCERSSRLSTKCYWYHLNVTGTEQCKPCPDPSQLTRDRASCTQCKYYYDEATFACTQSYVCPNASNIEWTLSDKCTQCGYGYSNDTKKCIYDCKSVANFSSLGIPECLYCYEFGANWINGTCKKTSEVYEHGIKGIFGSIDECDVGYTSRNYRKDGLDVYYCSKDYTLVNCDVQHGNYCRKCVKGSVLEPGNCNRCEV